MLFHRLACPDASITYIQFIEAAQSQLSNTASDYNIQLMVAGVALISCSTIGLLCLSLMFRQHTHSAGIWSFSQYFSVLALVLYASSMFASSFVEEEHYTWYYLAQTVTLLSAISRFVYTECDVFMCVTPFNEQLPYSRPYSWPNAIPNRSMFCADAPCAHSNRMEPQSAFWFDTILHWSTVAFDGVCFIHNGDVRDQDLAQAI